MAEVSLRDLNLTTEERDLLMAVIKNSTDVPEEELKRLAIILVNKGTSDAGTICGAICMAENRNIFRKFLLRSLQTSYQSHVDSDFKNEDSWCRLVGFLCAVFDFVRVGNLPLMVLIKPITNALWELSQRKYFGNQKAIACLAKNLKLIGKSLDRLNRHKMNELFAQVKKCLFSPESTPQSRLRLLEVIECRRGGWKLNQSALNFYSKAC